jgi:phage terminase large subunit GpA-like protein
MKAAQMGLTEVGINRAFYILDVLQRPVLYVLPTAVNATDFSKSRFGPALRLSPYLKRLFTDTNNVNLKQAGASTLYIRGSRGDSNLKSIPVSELILDEVDEMDQDQIWLALERLSGQLEKNVWAISTPGLPNKGIHKLYLPSTQEHFRFQCPRCSKHTELIWPDCIEIIGESIADKRCAESYLKCKECNGKLEHEDKPNWLAKAYWEQTNPDGDKDYRGFYINQLYSFTVTPGELVIAYHRGIGDEGAMSEFHKSKLGLPFIPDGGQISDEQIDNTIRRHTKQDPRPRGLQEQRCITMGVDQGDWLHIEITEWFADGYGRDINAAAFAKVLWQGKYNVAAENGWNRLDDLMREWLIYHCVVDADPNTNDARQFARRFPGYVTLCRYRRGVPQREMAITESDEFRTQIVTVDRTSWLDIALGRYKTATPRIALPRDVNLEYRDNMKNLVRQYTKDENNNPRAEYVNNGSDHYGHARCYSEIALPFAASYITNQDIKRFL